MTDQTTTPTTPVTPDPAAAPAAPVTTPAADTPPPSSTTPPADKPADQLLFNNPDGEPTDPPADDPNKPKDGEEGDADKDKDGDDKNKPEPMKVEDFKLEEGFVIPDETKVELQALLDNNDLSPKDKMQELLNLHQKVVKSQMEGFQQFREKLRDASKNDPVIGGDKLPQAVKEADNAVFQLCKNPKFGGSPELYNGFVQRLTLMGLGDDPYVIRFLNNTNKLLAHFKDDSVDGGSSGGDSQKPIEDILFGTRK